MARAAAASRSFARAAEASREARENRLRRAGWEPGQAYPGVDSQAAPPPVPSDPAAFDFSTDYSSEFA